MAGRYLFRANQTTLSAIFDCNRIMRLFWLTGFRCARCAGRINKDSTSENVSARMTTSEIARVNSAVPPPTNIHGAKKIMVVSTAKITGMITIFVPFVDAATPVSPSSILECIASPTMMASSTITPITSRKAKLEIILKETPNIGRSAIPPAIDTHMAMIGRRNSTSTISTRTRPDRKFDMIVPIRPE